jgi:hypothetical protein
MLFIHVLPLFYESQHQMIIFYKYSHQHTDTYVTLDVVVRASDSFGCHIMVQVALPGSFRDGETLLGLLGTPNEDM